MRIILDTKPVLKLFKGEDNGETVKKILELVEQKKLEGFISSISLTEIYYIYAREDEVTASQRVEQLRFSSLEVVPVEDNISIQAGKFKAKHSIPISDSIIAATAYVLDGIVVSDDPHFSEIEEIEVKSEQDLLDVISDKKR